MVPTHCTIGPPLYSSHRAGRMAHFVYFSNPPGMITVLTAGSELIWGRLEIMSHMHAEAEAESTRQKKLAKCTACSLSILKPWGGGNPPPYETLHVHHSLASGNTRVATVPLGQQL